TLGGRRTGGKTDESDSRERQSKLIHTLTSSTYREN
ncbi:MAG: hypothetical protein ACI91F_001974, partial [Candidatus Binatia bacterium]